MGTRRWTVCVALLGLLPAGIVRAQTPQEKKRGDILKDLGLKKKPPAPAPEPAPLPADEPPAPGGEKASAPGTATGKQKGASKGAAPAGPAAPSFARAVHPLFVTTCKPCHAPGAPGGVSRLLLSGDAAADHKVIARFVNARDPEASVLLGKVSGATMHAGGAPWPAAGAQYQRVLAWIRGGARLDAAAKAEPVAETAAAAPRVSGQPSRRAPAPTSGTGSQAAAVPPVEGEPVPAAPPAAEVGGPHPNPLPQAGEGERSAKPGAKGSAPGFAATVHPVLMSACAICHRPGAPAAMTRLLLSGDPTRDEAIVRPFVDVQAPEQSPLLSKARGEMHGGGPVLPPGDPRQATIVAWVRGLAIVEAPAPATGSAAAAAPSPAPAAAAPPAPAPGGGYGAPPGAHGGPGAPGLGLPFGFMLNGRFDLAYERRHFSGGPFEASSVNALRSYHHFLFLSHDTAGDPCGLSVEILTLQFWEAHCRVPGLPAPLRLTVAGGKIVVPFGADPLYHQNYGGLGGFDQPVLPIIWATEGAAAHLVVERREFVLTDDLFVVRGFVLPHADSIINLQSGFSPEDDVELGWGNRLGAAWRFVSAWYSAYYNPLGFGRRLFMQAFDLTVARPRGVPVLQHFSFGAGLLRADVSGGGPGIGGVGFDYYNFADYLQLRYYPTDWLYVQYRTGLRTFNNRRGVVLDKSRLTNADASTHNFAVVGRYRGLTGGLYYFINLEKVDEIPNDLLRLIVTYEF